MRQRVTMVISTLLNPSLLIADEVTSALDVSTQRAVGEMLMEFRDRGFVKSMIVITHDLSILAQIADSILIMYAGKLAEKAAAATIIDKPLHPYTQRLLASLPEVGVRYEDAALTGIPGRPPSLLNPPSGCRFRERCPLAFDKCAEDPPFIELRPGHHVACWKAAEDVGSEGVAPGPGGRRMSMLEIDKLSKVYKSGTFGSGMKPALRQVSFDIDQGEVVSLIGESGSGKSTLGKIILHLISASAGRVLFNGADVTQLRQNQLHDYYRNVQGVFQDPFSSYNPLYKADRVLELVRQEYFDQLSQQEWDAKVQGALETVALNPADVLNKFPHQLSGGQQQRLLVARALLLDVKLLIADEIISMLDASTRVDVLNMLVGLKRKGLAVLFITHDLSLGNYISDRTVILRYGAVVEMGATEKVFGNPQHSYTKHLLTAVPQLHRKWQAADEDRHLADGVANGSAATAHGAQTSTFGAAAPALAAPSARYSKSPSTRSTPLAPAVALRLRAAA